MYELVEIGGEATLDHEIGCSRSLGRDDRQMGTSKNWSRYRSRAAPE
jgi:hypothetical protein